ncbi:MAG: host attachment protein [Steroidobacteraceae bacterium]
MQYPYGTTIAVADGETLRILRNAGDEAHLRLEELAEPHLHGHNKGSGLRHHSSTTNHDASRLREDSFASAAADWLNERTISGEIERLFIVATPKTLGELRRHYHKTLEARLLGELIGEHTGDSLAHLHEVLVAP